MARTRLCVALTLVTLLSGSLRAQVAQRSTCRGWDTLKLSNGLLELQVAPDIGGRVIQLKLNQFEYLFVNEQLAGCKPPPSGVGPAGQWLNYGGEKLWPAPQGKDSPERWDGPPDPVLDGSPHTGTIVHASGDSAAIHLVSHDDPRSGIRFSRAVQVFADSSRVHVNATMTNIDTKPRRWGIWSVMQHNAANRTGSGYDQHIRVYCPLRSNSVFPQGFSIMRGPDDHTSFQADAARHMVVAHYERKMGKIGVDCAAGWVATVHGSAGYVLVQRFPYFPEKAYPDQASVEIWLHGPYGPKAAMTDAQTFPYFIESELLSPFARLAPGESYTFGYDWYAANLGGDYPVLDCTGVGVVSEPLTAAVEGNHLAIRGRFGVFCRGTAQLVFQDTQGRSCGEATVERDVSPAKPLVLAESLAVPPKEACTVTLTIHDTSGRNLGSLATAKIPTSVTTSPLPTGEG